MLSSAPPGSSSLIMAKVRSHLAHAPITEALIDFRVVPSGGLELTRVRRLADDLNDIYEAQGQLLEMQAQLSIAPPGGPQSEPKTFTRERGIRLRSRKDPSFILQIRPNGFTMSRLEPYQNWEHLLRETKSLWQRYADVTKASQVTRIATRFINNLKLPMQDGQGFEAYLTKPPDVPPEMPQGVLGFMQRIVIVDPVHDVKANIIQLLQEGVAAPDHVPIILDIDVYKTVRMSIDDPTIWESMTRLRVFKNEIFFASLTEPAVELFA